MRKTPLLSIWTAFRKLSTDVNRFAVRTHNCGQLRKSDIGKKVQLYGWLLKKRFSSFLIIHDKYGFVQVKIAPDSPLEKLAATLKQEDVLRVKGTVRSRGKDVNPDMDTGDVEVDVEELQVLNKSSALPFPVLGKLNKSIETEVENRKKLIYRYLELRKPGLQHALHLRADVVRRTRRCLEDRFGFIEVETPTLATHTPGGAAEFVVPTQLKGETYALPQSPQLYKQLLMIGQVDRYYQIARCYRDELVRGDRQPEFTQVDLELSFTTQEDVMSLIEQIVLDSWPDSMREHCPTAPFQRLTFKEAMFRYGSDKPDLRLPWVFEDCSSLFAEGQSAFGFVVREREGQLPAVNNLKRNFARLYPGSLHKNIRFFKNDGKSSINGDKDRDQKAVEQFKLETGDVLITAFDTRKDFPTKLLSTLGFARNFVASLLHLRSQKGFKFAWVTDFPLFVEAGDGSTCLESAHHPFTAPVDEDKEKLLQMRDLEAIRGQHYDLVVNGIEMGGGSIRINDPDMQKMIFDRVLNFPTDTLEPFLHALSFGAPPHGGFALGLDRYVACLAAAGDSTASVRDVIAFPKTMEGKCLMLKTPFEPDAAMKHRYGFDFVKKDEKLAEQG